MTALTAPTQPKATDLSWVPEIPYDWEVKRGKFLFDLQKRQVRDGDDIVTAFRNGQVTLRKKRRTDGFTNALKEAGYQRVHKGDLVIHAMDAFAGAVGVSDSEGKCTPVYSCCTPKEGVSAGFYARLIRTMAISGFIESLAKGIRERSTDFRWREFAEQSLPVPPYKKQMEINAFLDRETTRIDGLIEKKGLFIELLKEKRSALITHAVTKGIDADVPMKESGVEWTGNIPLHWEVTRLRFVADISNSNVDKKEYEGQVPVRLCNYTDVYYNETITPEFDFMVATASKEETKKFSLRMGDVIITKDSEDPLDIGIPAIVECDMPSVVCGYHLSIIRAEDPITADFIRYSFMSDTNKAHMYVRTPGITRFGLNQDTIKNILVFFPPFEERAKIVAELRRETTRIDDLVTKTERSIQLLKEKRSALITAAVTGKIDVRNAT